MHKWIAQVSYRFFFYILLCFFISSLQVNHKALICASPVISSKTQRGVNLCYLTLDKGTEGWSSSHEEPLPHEREEVKIMLSGGVIPLPFSVFSIGKTCSSETLHNLTYFLASLFLQSCFLSFGNRLKKKNYAALVTCVAVLTDQPTLTKRMLKFILQPLYPLIES